jgi:uncharacterized protein with NRDE domain
MCTIVAIKRRNPFFPLIIAANRDEYYARPASAPQIAHENPRVVAGLDLHKGGTWMGANARGIFVAITNQRTHARTDPKRASRGEVVLEALATEDVASIDELLASIDPREYNAFNLLYGDAEELRVAYARDDGSKIEPAPLDDGLWVLANDRIGSPEFPKADRVLSLIEPYLDERWEKLAPALLRALGDHEKPALDRIPDPPIGSRLDRAMLRELQSVCIHTAIYGTRSATVLALDRHRVAHYLFAEGPPCVTTAREHTRLFEESQRTE